MTADPARQIRVLVVEDSPLQSLALRRALEREGFGVESARDGVQGIDAVYQTSPDAVVSDVVMPELNGYQMCRLIRNDDTLSDLPVILLTSLDEPVDRFWGLSAGADRFLKKGGDDAELAATIRELVAARPPRERAAATQAEILDVRSRAAYLLDQLLLESTLTNRVRAVSHLADDPPALARAIVELLADLFEFTFVALTIRFESRPAVYYASRVDVADDALGAVVGLAGAARGRDPVRVDVDFEARGAVKEALGLDHPRSFELESDGVSVGTLTFAHGSPPLSTADAARIVRVVTSALTPVLVYLLRLEEVEALRRDFVAMLVHDLRAPLTGILGFAEILTDEDLSAETIEESAKVIHMSASRMLGLVNNILDAAKLRAGEMEIDARPTAAAPLVANVAQALAPVAAERGVELRTTLPASLPSVRADTRALERVVANLVSNAIKFTPRGGTVTVAAEVEGSYVRFDVVDTGIGIPESELEAIFDKYRDAGAAEGKGARGTGLGLFICNKIVEAHGGALSVASAGVGTGSTFSFTIPVAN